MGSIPKAWIQEWMECIFNVIDHDGWLRWVEWYLSNDLTKKKLELGKVRVMCGRWCSCLILCQECLCGIRNWFNQQRLVAAINLFWSDERSLLLEANPREHLWGSFFLHNGLPIRHRNKSLGSGSEQKHGGRLCSTTYYKCGDFLPLPLNKSLCPYLDLQLQKASSKIY